MKTKTVDARTFEKFIRFMCDYGIPYIQEDPDVSTMMKCAYMRQYKDEDYEADWRLKSAAAHFVLEELLQAYFWQKVHLSEWAAGQCITVAPRATAFVYEDETRRAKLYGRIYFGRKHVGSITVTLYANGDCDFWADVHTDEVDEVDEVDEELEYSFNALENAE